MLRRKRRLRDRGLKLKRRGKDMKRRNIESIKKQSASVKNKKRKQSVSDMKLKLQLIRRDSSSRQRLKPKSDTNKRKKLID